MLQEIVMPQLGLTMTEGSVSSWLKKPGEKVQRGEILFLVQTDKVEMEVESFVTGMVDSILVDPEVVVKVGTVIATVEDGRQATISTPPPAVQQAATLPAQPLREAHVGSTKSVSKGSPISPRAENWPVRWVSSCLSSSPRREIGSLKTMSGVSTRRAPPSRTVR